MINLNKVSEGVDYNIVPDMEEEDVLEDIIKNGIARGEIELDGEDSDQ